MLLLKPGVTQELKLEQIIWFITRLIVINIAPLTVTTCVIRVIN